MRDKTGAPEASEARARSTSWFYDVLFLCLYFGVVMILLETATSFLLAPQLP